MSATYAESSAVLRWLLGAPDGRLVRGILGNADAVVTSVLTGAEVGRTLQRQVSIGAISPDQRRRAWALYTAAEAKWRLHALTEDIVARAIEPFPLEPVRTLDALHLATALRYALDVAPVTVLSTDERVRENAVALGLAAAPA